ncbi:hypothetical protein CI102_9956 [Trichoderma harzianum]|nr:hypothetical protein CI102_9956 [Trichoderma harzianum]
MSFVIVTLWLCQQISLLKKVFQSMFTIALLKLIISMQFELVVGYYNPLSPVLDQ